MTPSSLNNLTDAEKRVRIAEACGATWSEDKFGNPMLLKDNLVLLIRTTEGKKFGGMDIMFHLSDYLNDLNAMAAAEATLTDEAHGKYRTLLQEVVNPKCGMLMTSAQYRAWFSATAKQRAEAFLATIAP